MQLVPSVEAINLGRRQALLTTGAVIAIANLIDIDGDITDDPQDAVSFTTEHVDGVGYLVDAVSTFITPKTKH